MVKIKYCLFSARTELIFFMVSGMMQCFGCRRKKNIDNTHRCFSCYWAVLYRTKNVSVFQHLGLSWQQGGWESTRSQEGTEPRHLIWTGQKDSMLYDIMWKNYRTEESWLRGWENFSGTGWHWLADGKHLLCVS